MGDGKFTRLLRLLEAFLPRTPEMSCTIGCFLSRVSVRNAAFLISRLTFSLIGHSPAMASSAPTFVVRKPPVIHRAAADCTACISRAIQPCRFQVGVHHVDAPYVSIETTLDMYSRRLSLGLRPLFELPSIRKVPSVLIAFVV